MNMRIVLLLASLLLFSSQTLLAADCKETPVGKCFSVHGRYATYVGGDAIGMIGTKRLLSTTDDSLDRMLV